MPAFVLDREDRITAINPSAELFLNTTVKSLEGEVLYDKLAIDAEMEGALARVRTNRSPLYINEVSVGTGTRPPVTGTIQVAPLLDEGRDAGRLLFIFSPREIAGRLVRSAQTETAAKSAVGMAEMLAHEIKNPLAGITGAAQLLSMSLDDGDRELCDLIVAETRRVTKLLEQVEQFGNTRPPKAQPVNIHDVLERARKSALVGFAAHMSIREDYDPSLPPAYADADQLLQVFQNLLKNAAEAAQRVPVAGAGRAVARAGRPSGGEIRLRTFYDSSLRVRGPDGRAAQLPLQVEVIDDGPGLPAAIASDIFEPFVSGRENGTGLGLALVSKIVADHGAFITVDSSPGRTAFRLSLPTVPKDAAATVGGTSPPAPGPTS